MFTNWEYNYDRYAEFVNPEDPESISWGLGHNPYLRAEAEAWLIENPEVVNLTPHEVGFVLPDGTEKKFAPSGTIARCKAYTVQTGQCVMGIPVTETQMGDLEDLPDPVPGYVFVVSRVVADKAKKLGRVDDLFIPNESIRDSEGRIVGCRSLGRV